MLVPQDAPIFKPWNGCWKIQKNTTAVKFLQRSPDFRRLKKNTQKFAANQKSESLQMGEFFWGPPEGVFLWKATDFLPNFSNLIKDSEGKNRCSKGPEKFMLVTDPPQWKTDDIPLVNILKLGLWAQTPDKTRVMKGFQVYSRTYSSQPGWTKSPSSSQLQQANHGTPVRPQWSQEKKKRPDTFHWILVV